MWTLDEALPFLKSLRKAMLKCGYCVALAGSILYRGRSEKDLDVILFPHGRIPQGDVYEALEAFGLTLRRDRAAVTADWRTLGSLDTKHVEEWRTKDGRRIDIFFLQ